MKWNDAAHIILTIDSSLKARKNDPSLSEDTKENSNRKKRIKSMRFVMGLGSRFRYTGLKEK